MFFEQQRPHAIRGTIEIDVTDTLARIRFVERETRIALPFHVFAVHCVAQCVSENPGFNTYRRGDKLMTLADVDVYSALDKRLPNGVRIPVGHIVRGAQGKSLATINWELRLAIRSADLADDPAVKLRRRLAGAPAWARRRIGRWIVSDPLRLRQSHGTVLVSTVQPKGFARPSSIIAGTVHTFTASVGAIAERIALDAEGKAVRRKILFLSGACDHDILDGVAIAKFCGRLVELFESGAGVDAAFVAETQALKAGAPA
jgi:pyruvate/2-oxoglutarate dehydrogenase complex dihydrolipoamide acyltransferase (E2) component